MYEATIDVEAVTPIFMYGAMRHPEIRATSIKGLMRWWFRAIMGGLVSLKKMKSIEETHFGSTKNKSKVNVRVITSARAVPFNINKIKGMGLRYLWFPFILIGRRKGSQLMYYDKGTKFKIVITSSKEDSFNLALGSLWTLIHLGGIGARSRRGCGSLKVNRFHASDRINFSFVLSESNPNGIKRFVEENLLKISEVFKRISRKDNTDNFGKPNKNFAVLSKDSARAFIVSKSYSSWENALNDVGIQYSSFRRYRIKPMPKRRIFGLPVSPRSRSSLRYASPLIFGVFEVNYQYYTRILKFYKSIHPNYSSDLNLLESKLNEYDDILNKSLGEIKINLP